MSRAVALAVVVVACGACVTCPPRPPPPPGCGSGECEPSSLSWRDLVLFMDDRPAPFEVAPWINFGAGARIQSGATARTSAAGAGVEGTFGLHGDTGNCAQFAGPGCPAWLPRLGPWAAIESTYGLTRPHVDGGLAFDLGGPRHLSWSTFGARVGVGRGEGATDVGGQLSWGMRFVKMRSQGIHDGGPCRAIVAPVTGLRLYAAARRELGGAEALTLTFGLEWRPFGRHLGLP